MIRRPLRPDCSFGRVALIPVWLQRTFQTASDPGGLISEMAFLISAQIPAVATGRLRLPPLYPVRALIGHSYIDLTAAMGRGFMAMMSAMAEDERLQIIKAQTKQALHRMFVDITATGGLLS
jgi:hypothetical protein